jgi:hypothetical protein
MKNLKMLSRSSPIFVLSNHATFSQTQTGATVPLKASASCWRETSHSKYSDYFSALAKNAKQNLAYYKK